MNYLIKMDTNYKLFLYKNKNWISVLLFIFIFVIINFLRFNSTTFFPAEHSYIFLNELSQYDSFNFQGNNLFYEITLELSFIFGDFLSKIIMLFITSLINILLFNKLISIVIKKEYIKVLCAFFFLFSNLFIASFTSYTFIPLILTFILWSLIFFFRNQKFLFMPLILSQFIGFYCFLANFILIFLLFIFVKYKKNYSNNIINISSKKFINLNFILPIVFLIILYFFNGLAINDLTVFNFINTWWLIDLNGWFIIPILYIILALFALFIDYSDHLIKFISLFIIALSWINIYISIIAMLITIIFASVGLYNIMTRKWFIQELKQITLFFIILLLVFNLLSFGQMIVESEPSENLINDIKSFNNYVDSKDNFFVLTDNSDAIYLNYFSDFNIYNSDNYNVDEIFQNSNFKLMNKIFNEENISYVFISKDNVRKTWGRSDEGLLLLLTQSNSFIKLNNSNEVIIYEYVNNITNI